MSKGRHRAQSVVGVKPSSGFVVDVEKGMREWPCSLKEKGQKSRRGGRREGALMAAHEVLLGAVPLERAPEQTHY